MKSPKTEKIWNFLSSVLYIVLIVVVGYIFKQEGIRIEKMDFLTLLILMLATYRLTRIIVYDKVMKIFRDLIKSIEGTGIGNSMRTIVTCPWCAGVWVALFVVVVFFLIPFGEIFIYIMAISGVGTFVQLVVNYVGLLAEDKQMDVLKKKNETDYRH